MATEAEGNLVSGADLKCPICKKIVEGSLGRHLWSARSVRNEVSIYVNTKCKQQDGSGNDRYVCPACHSTFKRSHGLVQHLHKTCKQAHTVWPAFVAQHREASQPSVRALLGGVHAGAEEAAEARKLFSWQVSFARQSSCSCQFLSSSFGLDSTWKGMFLAAQHWPCKFRHGDLWTLIVNASVFCTQMVVGKWLIQVHPTGVVGDCLSSHRRLE